MFYLKAGDEVIIKKKFVDGKKESFKGVVIGFYCYGMHIKSVNHEEIIPFHCGRFYAVGYYHEGSQIYTLKKLWHYLPAQICEKIRLKLSDKLGKLIFGL